MCVCVCVCPIRQDMLPSLLPQTPHPLLTCLLSWPGTEIAIVLDGSGSIDPPDFQRAKDFIANMMTNFSEKCFEVGLPRASLISPVTYLLLCDSLPQNKLCFICSQLCGSRGIWAVLSWVVLLSVLMLPLAAGIWLFVWGCLSPVSQSGQQHWATPSARG